MAPPNEAEVARARKLLELRGKGDAYRRAAVEKQIKALPPNVLAAARGEKPAGRAKPPSMPAKAPSAIEYAEAHFEGAPDGIQFQVLPNTFKTQLLNGDVVDGPYGGGINLNAKALIDNLAKAAALGDKLEDAVAQLRILENEVLPAQLKSLQNVHADGSLGHKISSNSKVVGDAADYTATQPELRGAAKHVDSTYHAMLAAASGLKVAAGIRRERKAEGVEAAAEAHLKEVEANAAQTKEIIKKGLGEVKELAKKGPHEYLISKGAELVDWLEDKAIDFMVDDYYAPQRQAAEKALAAAQKAVEDLKDAIELDRIDQATQDLLSNKSEYESSLDKFFAAATRAADAETNLTLDAEEMGLEDVGAAIEGKPDTIATAKQAKKDAADYMAISEQIAKSALTLEKEYQDYMHSMAPLMKSDSDPPISDHEKGRAQVHGIANQGELQARAVHDQAIKEADLAKDDQKYLAGESYLKNYEEIEAELAKAMHDRPRR